MSLLGKCDECRAEISHYYPIWGRGCICHSCLILGPRKFTMADHDDTPSTAEHAAAREQLRSEGHSESSGFADFIDKQVECNRLAARVAELESVVNGDPDGWVKMPALIHWRDRAVAAESRLAKLRAAAAPVPEGWDPVEDQGCGTRYMNGPWNDEMWHHADDTLRVSTEGGEATVPAAAVRHLLALPVQPDCRAALRRLYHAREQLGAWVDCSGQEREAYTAVCDAIRLIAAAPRTEGGGDHGE
jgi:hypothetical protein